MEIFEQTALRNRLLRYMSSSDFALVAPHLSRIRLPLASILEEPGQVVDFVVFFENGIGSNIVVGSDDQEAESGHVGYEGMSGRTVVLGSGAASTRIRMQVAGDGFTIPSVRLAEAMDGSPTLRRLMNAFVLASESQAAHTLLAATSFGISQRLARWILMYDDRIEGDMLPVTHEVLSMMLGVRRAGVTQEMHVLEGEHAIKATRGMVRVVDRMILIRLSGGCYGMPELEYERLFDQHNHTPVPASFAA
jgi:hypothetical protein